MRDRCWELREQVSGSDKGAAGRGREGRRELRSGDEKKRGLRKCSGADVLEAMCTVRSVTAQEAHVATYVTPAYDSAPPKSATSRALSPPMATPPPIPCDPRSPPSTSSLSFRCPAFRQSQSDPPAMTRTSSTQHTSSRHSARVELSRRRRRRL